VRRNAGAFAVALVAAVACASYGAAVSVEGSAGAATSVRGVTATAIKVGGLGDNVLYANAGKAAQARFDAANRDHEIPGGRTIQYIGFANDTSNPDTNASETRRLVEQEQVFALVPMVTPVFADAGTYVNQQRVPTVGWGIAAGFCTPQNRYAFGVTGCTVPDAAGYASNAWGNQVDTVLRRFGKQGAVGKTAAVVADNNDVGKQRLETTAATAEAVGMKVVYKQAVAPAPPASAIDFGSLAQPIMTASNGGAPDVVFLATSPGNAFGLGAALDRAGFKGITTSPSVYTPAFPAATLGWQAFTQFATAESGAPTMANVTATLKAAGVDPADESALAGYFAADLFVQVVRKVGKRLTPERFQRTAGRFSYEVPAVVGPTVFPAAYRAPTPCGQLAVSDGTKYTVDAPFACSDVLLQKRGAWVRVPYPKGVR
jgi:ABC-type branched-subunit amino acid transport system substrate-binding protein